VIPGAGGVRKLRWGMEGRGKRGGARVIYYFADRSVPVFLLKAYSKSVRADITAAERREFREFAQGLRRSYRRNPP